MADHNQPSAIIVRIWQPGALRAPYAADIGQFFATAVTRIHIHHNLHIPPGRIEVGNYPLGRSFTLPPQRIESYPKIAPHRIPRRSIRISHRHTASQPLQTPHKSLAGSRYPMQYQHPPRRPAQFKISRAACARGRCRATVMREPTGPQILHPTFKIIICHGYSSFLRFSPSYCRNAARRASVTITRSSGGSSTLTESPIPTISCTSS